MLSDSESDASVKRVDSSKNKQKQNVENHSTSTSDKQQGNSARATRPSDEQARHVHVLPQCDTARSVTGDSVGLEVTGDGQGSEVVTHSQVDLTIAA